jgi:hypothetical protein
MILKRLKTSLFLTFGIVKIYNTIPVPVKFVRESERPCAEVFHFKLVKLVAKFLSLNCVLKNFHTDKRLPGPSVADPGCFIRIQTFFHPGSYMKVGMQTYFFLASYAFRSKVLVIVKKIRDPGSGKNSSRIRNTTGIY